MKKFEFGKVHCVDCLKVMKKLLDNSIDAVITNPSLKAGLKTLFEITGEE